MTVPNIFATAVAGDVPASQLDENFAYLLALGGALNPIAYGADPTGVSDSTAAFDAALAAGSIVVTPGTYLVSSLASISGRSIVGAGYETCILLKTGGTGNLLTVGAGGYVTVSGIQIQAVAPQTAGSFVNLNGGPFSMSNFGMFGAFVGVTVADAIGDWSLRDGIISGLVATTGVGVLVGTGTGTAPVAGVISDVVMSSLTGAKCAAHICLKNCGDLIISGCNLILGNRGLQIIPGNGQNVSSVKCSDTFFDQAGVYGLEIAPTGTGAVARSTFNDCWAAQAGTANVSMVASGTNSIDGISLINLDNFGGPNGIVISGLTVTNTSILGGQHAGATPGSAISLADNQTFSIIGARIGASGGFGGNITGITISGAAAYGIVHSNNLNDSVTPITNTAPAAVSIRNNLGYVTENRGTGSIASGSTAATITHGLSVTPAAANISVTFTENPSTDPGNIWVDTITSTQFNVNCRTNPGASNLDFSWQAIII